MFPVKTELRMFNTPLFSSMAPPYVLPEDPSASLLTKIELKMVWTEPGVEPIKIAPPPSGPLPEVFVRLLLAKVELLMESEAATLWAKKAIPPP